MTKSYAMSLGLGTHHGFIVHGSWQVQPSAVLASLRVLRPAYLPMAGLSARSVLICSDVCHYGQYYHVMQSAAGALHRVIQWHAENCGGF